MSGNGHDPNAHAVAMAALNLRETIAAEPTFLDDADAIRHRELVGAYREQWPALWEAIDRLVATTKGYRT